MGFDNGLAYSEPQTNSLASHFLAVLNLVKFFEDALLVIVRHSWTCVRNGDCNETVVANDSSHDLVVTWRKLQRVFVEISDDLDNSFTIALDEDRRRLTLQP